MPSHRSGFPASSVLGSSEEQHRAQALRTGATCWPGPLIGLQSCVFLCSHIVEGESSLPNGHGYEEHLVS